MYKLSTGNIDNTKHLYMVDVHSNLRDIIKRTHSLYNVQYAILSDKFDEENYDDIATALTIGDELYIPISQEEAKLLFFILNVNMSNSDFRIKSIVKAYNLYNEFEGDYSKVTVKNVDSIITEICTVKYTNMINGMEIKYEIPFYTIESVLKTTYAIADLRRYVVYINGKQETIGRKAFNELFENNANNTVFNKINLDLLTNMFRKDARALIEAITSAGFEHTRIPCIDANLCELNFNKDLNDITITFSKDAIAQLDLIQNNWRHITDFEYYISFGDNMIALQPKNNNIELYYK